MMIQDCVKFWLKFEDIFKDIWWYAVWSALVIVFFVPADSGFSAALHKLSLTLGQPFIWFFSMLCLKSPGCSQFISFLNIFLPLLFNAAWTFLGNLSSKSFKEVSGKDSQLFQLSSITVWNAAPIHDRTSTMFHSWLKTFRVVPLYSPPLYMLMTRWIKKMPKKIKIWIDQL